MELNEKQQLEYEILQTAIKGEKSTPYQGTSASTQSKSLTTSSPNSTNLHQLRSPRRGRILSTSKYRSWLWTSYLLLTTVNQISGWFLPTTTLGRPTSPTNVCSRPLSTSSWLCTKTRNLLISYPKPDCCRSTCRSPLPRPSWLKVTTMMLLILWPRLSTLSRATTSTWGKSVRKIRILSIISKF